MRRLVVDGAAFRQNVEAVLAEMAGVPVIGVCKGNGMGVGTLPYAKALLEAGVSSLAVAAVEEGATLREGGVTCPILMLSSTSLPSEVEALLKLDITPTVGSAAAASALAGTGAAVHIKVDTGFGRYGFMPGEEETAARAVREAGLEAAGIFTHFSRSFTNTPDTARQLEAFLRFADKLAALGVDPPLRHAANSCGALLHPETRLSAVRIGSAFVGRLPAPSPIPLAKIGWLEADIAELHKLPKGHNVGYTNVCYTGRPTRTALVTAGLADGIGISRGKDAFRAVDNARYIWHAVKDAFRPPVVRCLINGKTVPTLGRVGLTGVVADVTDIDCAVGDVARFEVNPLMVDSSVPRVWR
ncbi:MAG TPA: alanine racemase [Candidatus Acidoferrum sp.]|nr:alanine racemase [Candidatus Acidoferrum sp.]